MSSVEKNKELISDDIIKINKNDDSISSFITDKSMFNDDIWDFSSSNKDNRANHSYFINFDNINNEFKYYVKKMAQTEKNTRKNKITSVSEDVSRLKEFLSFLEKNGVLDVRLINFKSVHDYLEKKKLECSIGHARRLGSLIKKFLKEVRKKNEELSFEEEYKYIESLSVIEQKSRRYKAANNYIPDKFLNQIVSLAVKDINNEELDINSRIISALIVILAETGMRVEDLTLLEYGRLKEYKFGEDKSIDYLEFTTFKNKKETFTYLSEISKMAYLKLMSFVDITVKRFEGRKEVNERYLYINADYGTQIKGTGPFRERLLKFFIRHTNEFDLTTLTSQEIKMIKFVQVKSESKYYKVRSKGSLPFKEIENVKFCYVNPHMFRVTVCTKLFRRNVHIDYIRRHMNHLTDDMTQYYNKSEEFRNSLEEGIKILAEISNDNGELALDYNTVKGDFFKKELEDEEYKNEYEKINEFLSKNKFNIKKDIKDIIKVLEKTSTPILDLELGICVRNAIHGICERRKYFSSISDNYYLGLKLPSVELMHYTYDTFKQKVEIVKHNKKLAEKDSRYQLEYDRERKALSMYLKKTLLKEIDLTKKEIEEFGEEIFIKKYPNLKFIVSKLDYIRTKEVEPWII